MTIVLTVDTDACIIKLIEFIVYCRAIMTAIYHH